MASSLLKILYRVVPESVRYRLSRQWYRLQALPVGEVNWGDLRRLTPISPVWPNYRGRPVDRYYIEDFLAAHANAIRGHVLELGDATYTRRFGGQRVSRIDVLHAKEGNPAATIVADLTKGDQLASVVFDCIILTQTLLFIYDLQAAVQTLHRILKPGGTILVTIPGISPIIRNDMIDYGQFWSFTEQSVRKLFAGHFPEQTISTQTYGNVLTSTAFLYGLATEELEQHELDYHDPDYPLIIGLKAVKPKASRHG